MSVEETKVDETEKVVETNVAEMIHERDSLKEENIKLEKQVEELTKSLKQATDLLNDQTRGKLIKEVQTLSTLGNEALSEMSTEELKATRDTLKFAKAKVFKSSGDLGSSDPYDIAMSGLYDKFKFGKK